LLIYDSDNWTEPTVISALYPPLINVAVTSDDTQIALVESGKIRVIDGATYQLLYELDVNTYRRDLKNWIQFTDRYLLALLIDSHYDYDLRIWERTTGKLIDTIPASSEISLNLPSWALQDRDVDEMIAAQAHPIATAIFYLPTLNIDGVERSPVQAITAQDMPYTLYRLCPDDQPEVWNCTTSTILIRNQETGQTKSRFNLDTNGVGFINKGIEYIGTLVCIEEEDEPYDDCHKWQFGVVETETGDTIHIEPSYFINQPQIMPYSPDEQFVVIADSVQVQVFDAHSFHLIAKLTGFHGPPIDVEFSLNGKWLASSSNGLDGGRAINLWGQDQGVWKKAQSIPCGGRIALHPFDNVLMCGGASNGFWGRTARMERWRLDNQPSLLKKYNDELVLDVAFSPDGEWLVVGQYATIELRDYRTNKTQITVESMTPYSVARYSQDMRYLYLYLNDIRPLRYVWEDIQDLERLSFDETSPFMLNSDERWQQWTDVAISDNARWLAVSRHGQTVEIYDADTEKLVHELQVDGGAVELRFSPDNEFVASIVCQITHIEGNEACSLYLISVALGEVVFRSQMFEEAIFDVAFAPDGRFIATSHGFISVHYYEAASSENFVRLWGIPTVR
jgi:WD40 repeat protein